MFSGGTDKQYRAVIDLRVHIIIISNNRIFTVVMLKSERKKNLKQVKGYFFQAILYLSIR